MTETRAGRWIVLVTALAQAASPAVAGFDQGRPHDPRVLDRPSAPLLGALLCGAVLSVIALVAAACRTLPARLAAGLTGVWALLGVTLSTVAAGATALAALAVLGGVAVAVTTLVAALPAHGGRGPGLRPAGTT
ncbi:hypothetical protein [Catenuloplanes atrovinosus]|uniref:Peptidoglycan/LPS O-acetylase OafA/YrhL n=1 Tax=Catenuloplanes atrovinosus TaxID=137266 RepID=A0AAE4CD36_9ACTN|nr:hypothetical protein [Catenuloplanes atrovinosus]MDR7278654.1 peptidoglycan/LPS O-acetylase OafA/YrhL [Catenuloplanes atrovinosus]